MKIKSLLLGSAAAMAAVSGARAADAVMMAQPEPVEYVRVCDAYGSGFYYIPGTETCIKFSGLVRYQIAVSSEDNMGPEDAAPRTIRLTGQGWDKSTRARLNVDVRSDTEWGTLRGYFRWQSNFNALTGDNGVGTEKVLVELGGFRAGYYDSAYATTQYGGNTGFGGFTDSDGAYGNHTLNLMAYSMQFGQGGFGTISLEDDANANYTPDVVGSVGINQGWGAVWVNVAYDEAISPTDDGSGTSVLGSDAWNVKGGLHLVVPNVPGGAFRLIGMYSSDDNRYDAGGEWSILTSYTQNLTSTVSVAALYQYTSDTNFSGVGSPDQHDVVADIAWSPVTNFEVRLEGSYQKRTGEDSTQAGFLRFTRSF
jgi:hypothetical protein